MRYMSADDAMKLIRSGDTISLNYGFSGFTGYCYDELGQIRLVIGDCLYYFQQG